MKNIEIIIGIVFTLLIAWVASNVIAHIVNKDDARISDAQMYLDKLTLGLLLPLVFMFSLMKANLSVVHCLLLVLGALLPLITLFSGEYFHLKSEDSDKPEAYWKPFMFATFGGGNRGTLLILVLAPLVIPAFNANLSVADCISYFAMFDLGNFICLMLIFKRHLMPDHLRKSLKLKAESISHQDIKGSETDILKYIPGGAAVVGLAYSLFTKLGGMDQLKSLFPEALHGINPVASLSEIVSHIFTFIVFLSIFLFLKKSQGRMDLEDWIRIIRNGLFSRFIGIVVCSLILLTVNSYLYFMLEIENLMVVVLCIGIFLILPPSSLFSIIVGDINQEYEQHLKKDNAAAYGKYEAQLSKLVLTTIYFYFFIMLVVFGYAIATG